MSNMTTAAASVIGIVFLKQVNLCNDSNGAIPTTPVYCKIYQT